jgi:hypothetical protein
MRPAYSGLASLADQTMFEVCYGAVASAIADQFALKTHYNVAALQEAYGTWIAKCAAHKGSHDPDHFVAVIGILIESLVTQKIISYSAMIRPPEPIDPHLAVVLNYPVEVTGLLAGVATYAVPIMRLTGNDPSIPLSALILENAAGAIRRRPEAARRFRELLQLTTPWS